MMCNRKVNRVVDRSLAIGPWRGVGGVCSSCAKKYKKPAMGKYGVKYNPF